MKDKFKPVLIGGKDAKATGEIPKGKSTIKDALLAFLETVKKEVEADRVTGIIAILIDEDGEQDETAITDENDYTMLGRLTAMSGNVSLGISAYDDEDFEEDL